MAMQLCRNKTDLKCLALDIVSNTESYRSMVFIAHICTYNLYSMHLASYLLEEIAFYSDLLILKNQLF